MQKCHKLQKLFSLILNNLIVIHEVAGDFRYLFDLGFQFFLITVKIKLFYCDMLLVIAISKYSIVFKPHFYKMGISHSEFYEVF